MKEKTTRVLRQISLKTILIAALIMVAIFIFGLVVDEIILEKEDIFDSRVISLVAPYRTVTMITVMRFFTFFGSSLFLLPAYLALVIYYSTKHNKAYAINIALMGVASSAVVYGLKLLFHRQRPNLGLVKQLKTYSFPSGHAVSSFIFCSILIYLVWQGNARPALKWASSFLLLFFTFTIGMSRIVLGVHYPSDVLAGFCLGLIWVLATAWFLKKKPAHNTMLKQDSPG